MGAPKDDNGEPLLDFLQEHPAEQAENSSDSLHEDRTEQIENQSLPLSTSVSTNFTESSDTLMLSPVCQSTTLTTRPNTPVARASTPESEASTSNISKICKNDLFFLEYSEFELIRILYSLHTDLPYKEIHLKEPDNMR